MFQLENACVSRFYLTIVLLKQGVCKLHFYQWDAVCLWTSRITPKFVLFSVDLQLALDVLGLNCPSA